MTKRYWINVHVSHAVEVVADSLEEAEERALDRFSDEVTDWDMCDIDVLDEEEI